MAAGDKIQEILTRLRTVVASITPTVYVNAPQASTFKHWQTIWNPQKVSDQARWRAFHWRVERRTKGTGAADATRAPYAATLVLFVGYPEDVVVKDSSGTQDVAEMEAIDAALLDAKLSYAQVFRAGEYGSAVGNIDGFTFLGETKVSGGREFRYAINYRETIA